MCICFNLSKYYYNNCLYIPLKNNILDLISVSLH